MEHTGARSEPATEDLEITRGLWRAFLMLALPLMVGGGLAVWSGIHALGQSDSGGWGFVGVGGGFLLMGLVCTVILIVARFKLRRGDFDPPDHVEGKPGPWQVRRDWANGQVQSEDRNQFVTAVVGAVFGSLIAAIAILSFRPDSDLPPWASSYLRNLDDHMGWFSYVFAAGGVFMLLRAAWLGLRWSKYGDSLLQLRTVPLTPGGPLEGMIQVPRRFMPQGGIRLRVICVKEVRPKGKRRHRREEKLWSSEHAVPNTALEIAPRGLAIPVAFQLAAEAPPSRRVDQAEVFWRLEARAAMPGLNYAADFVLPVF